MDFQNRLPSVFISYNWNQSDLADGIESRLDGKAIIARDKNHPYWSSLTEFMKTIRKQDFAILLVSDDFLKSTNCMYEVSQLVKDDDWERRVMFVVADDTKIYSVLDHEKYINYWQASRERMEKTIGKSPKQSVDGYVDELRKIDEIQVVISQFLMKVKDSKNPRVEDAISAIIKRVSGDNSYVCEEASATRADGRDRVDSIERNEYIEQAKAMILGEYERNRSLPDDIIKINRLFCMKFDCENPKVGNALDAAISELICEDLIYRSGLGIHLSQKGYDSVF